MALVLCLLPSSLGFATPSLTVLPQQKFPPRAVPTMGSLADFIAGEWEMDLSSSDGLGPLLRELGLNRILAAVVTRLQVKQSITMESDALTVVVKTSLSEETMRLPFDGRCSVVPGLTGGRSACITRWLDAEKTQLETRQTLSTAPSDAEALSLPAAKTLDAEAFVTVRSLRDDGKLLVESCTVVRDGVELSTLRADRILKRLG